MTASKTNLDFSPLDRIRQAEAEITRRAAAARDAAEQMLAEARLNAQTIKRQAQEVGRREGQAQYEEIVKRAEEEAKAMISQAHQQAEEIRRSGTERMSVAVHQAVSLILGIENEA